MTTICQSSLKCNNALKLVCGPPISCGTKVFLFSIFLVNVRLCKKVFPAIFGFMIRNFLHLISTNREDFMKTES